jgi:hypothetical protein
MQQPHQHLLSLHLTHTPRPPGFRPLPHLQRYVHDLHFRHPHSPLLPCRPSVVPPPHVPPPLNPPPHPLRQSPFLPHTHPLSLANPHPVLALPNHEKSVEPPVPLLRGPVYRVRGVELDGPVQLRDQPCGTLRGDRWEERIEGRRKGGGRVGQRYATHHPHSAASRAMAHPRGEDSDTDITGVQTV